MLAANIVVTDETSARKMMIIFRVFIAESDCQPQNINESDLEDCTHSKSDCAHDRRVIANQISRALCRARKYLPCAGACEPDRRTRRLQRCLGDASRYRLLCLGWRRSS